MYEVYRVGDGYIAYDSERNLAVEVKENEIERVFVGGEGPLSTRIPEVLDVLVEGKVERVSDEKTIEKMVNFVKNIY